ncbi:hypothetical protein [Wenxinia marina]|uniref:Uncharacterized protein n=1 Tax=Wenxinia marina DSM 24838 TaxID=1123501 RepID=A0A0D0Q964_9RHOB|nr:hypothetical protein [Wenxinia marina]KIQ68917.1 hypothetical protein Wenmar_02649 [Wenxinia marina DSM 24838]GGL64181.1 hypothetical protein GCM10011392_18530 [Wenxinia marina]
MGASQRGLIWVVLLILWVAWVGALDLSDTATRTWLIHSVLMTLVATEAFLWRLRQTP